MSGPKVGEAICQDVKVPLPRHLIARPPSSMRNSLPPTLFLCRVPPAHLLIGPTIISSRKSSRGPPHSPHFYLMVLTDSVFHGLKFWKNRTCAGSETIQGPGGRDQEVGQVLEKGQGDRWLLLAEGIQASVDREQVLSPHGNWPLEL